MNYLPPVSNHSSSDPIYSKDCAVSAWVAQSSMYRKSNQMIKELYDTSFNNHLKEALPKIHLCAPEQLCKENSQHFFSQDWNEPDDLCNVKVELEEIPMEMYHYSRFIPEDGSCVQGFLTRINDEELPSYILPDDGPFDNNGTNSIWTRPLDPQSEEEYIGNERTDLQSSTTQMIGETDVLSPSSTMEDSTFHDHNYNLPKSAESAKENVFPEGSNHQFQQKSQKDRTKKHRFSNFSRKWTKKSFPSVIESVVNDWKPPSHLGTSAPTAPLKKFKIRIPFGNIAARPVLVVPEVSVLKPIQQKSATKPKYDTLIRSYSKSSKVPLKSVTIDHSAEGLQSLIPKKITTNMKRTVLSISKCQKRWFRTHLPSIPADAIITIPIPTNSGSLSIRLPRSVLEKVSLSAVEKKKAISFPVWHQSSPTSSDPNGIASSAKPTGLIVSAYPQHPQQVFLGPFPATFNGPFPSSMIPLHAFSVKLTQQPASNI